MLGFSGGAEHDANRLCGVDAWSTPDAVEPFACVQRAVELAAVVVLIVVDNCCASDCCCSK